MKPSEFAALVRPRLPECRPLERRLASCHTIDDLRRVARRRLPRAAFDYIDGGAEDEVTLRRNRAAFEDFELVPRVLCDVEVVDTTTTILGGPAPLPLALAPTGFTRLMHYEGELAVARAAGRTGVPYALSTVGTTSIERLAAATTSPLWFQLYTWRDRGFTRELIERAQAAGYRALLLTVDVPVPGARERDLRNGLTIPPTVGLRTLVNGALHPSWWWRFLTSEALTFENVSDRAADPSALMDYIASQFAADLTWSDVEWMLEAWDGAFVIKGILSVDDARRAAAAGVSGIIVSNHGGRQLDHSAAPIDVLPEIVAAVGDRLEVLVDSGVRRGVDVVKAVALGAKACLVGRAYLYGLGAAGERGVEHAIALLNDEFRRAMALVGARSVKELDGSLIRRRGQPRTA